MSIMNPDLIMAGKPNGFFIWKKKIMGTRLTMIQSVAKYSYLPDIFIDISEKFIIIP